MRLAACLSILAATTVLCSLGAGSLRAQPPANPQAFDEPHVWTDVTGKFSRTAVLIEVREDAVRLRQPSGRCTTIAWDKLSPQDQQYARDFVENSAGPPAGEPTRERERTWTDVTGRLRHGDAGCRA